MNINLLSYTKIPNSKNDNFSLEDSLSYSAKLAGICYMKDPFEAILNEDKDKTDRRLNQVLNSMHHSVFDHVKLTFEIAKVSKIIAMIINNEKDYSTSEKSGRYTIMTDMSSRELELYDKWKDKLTTIIYREYPKLYNEKLKNPMMQIEKLAQENARNFISIFSPCTTLAYTTSLRQLNYLLYIIENYANNLNKSEYFENRLYDELITFVSLFKDYRVTNLIPKGKNRCISLLNNTFKDTPEHFSYTYVDKFKASFPCVGQLQRHRTENYFITIPKLDNMEFFVPDVLNKEEKNEWLSDCDKSKDLYIQGTLVDVVNSGTIDTFLLKTTERLCSQAQYEIMKTTKNTLNKYINSDMKEYILDYTNDKYAKCKFKNGFCSKVCMLGPNQIERKI